jgi:hypothetical protein
MQIFTELALAFDEYDLAFHALDQLDGLGFMDITWLDSCPLVERVADQPRFAQLRQRVGDRAARVLAAFDSVTSHA